MTPAQNKMLHTLLHSTGMSDHKPELVRAYTSGRTASSAEMDEREAGGLIDHLERHVMQMEKSRKSNTMRRKIIAMAHQLGWTAEGKIDMTRVNAWCVKNGFGHKPLNAYSYEELPKLVSVFETMYKQVLEKI